MKQKNPFVISQFTNPSGEIVFRVYGRIDGQRIRKNFPTRAEAEAERQVLELKWVRDTNTRAAITRLNEDQLREAEAVFARLEGKPRSLALYVDFALTNYREPETERKLPEAITEYVAMKQHEHDQDLLSVSQLGRIRRDLRRLQKFFPDATVTALTGPRLVGFFEMGWASLKTYNNRRGIVSTFLKYAFLKGWIADNPLARVPAHRIRRRRGAAQTLSAGQAREMMEQLEGFEGGRWVPFFAMTLFAGIRPAVPEGEICRLKPEAIDLKTRVISISAEVSKVREARQIAIQPNLAAWLRAYPLGTFPLIVPDFQRRRAELSKRFGLTHDVLRHTFISMFVAKFRSLGEAALQAGNSESIIRKHYLELKTRKEADEFFGIIPKHARVPAVSAKAVEATPPKATAPVVSFAA